VLTVQAHTAGKWLGAALCALCVLPAGTFAADLAAVSKPVPAIALIIDDLGNQRVPGRRAVSLPGPVACAFLPDGPFTRELAQQAHARNKEVMLHLPMQAAGTLQNEREAGQLTLDMTHRQYLATLERDLAAVPYVSGLNNHRGSLLTRHPGNMAWLMQALRERGNLFFIDSRTTTATVARRMAYEHGIPSSERNVFLDNEPEASAIRWQFRRLIRIAQRDGTALAIGHPHPATIEVLNEELHRLGQSGVRLVPVAELIEMQKDRQLVWQTSSSR
jgi:polysaccharide deacetylase 2 family uncharacterized protein YibQ